MIIFPIPCLCASTVQNVLCWSHRESVQGFARSVLKKGAEVNVEGWSGGLDLKNEKRKAGNAINSHKKLGILEKRI